MYDKWQVILIMISGGIAAYMAYWNGYNKGKREGYITGRSISRVPNER